MKKFIFLIAIFIFCLAFPAFAAETFEYNNIMYTIELVSQEGSDETSLVVTASAYTTDTATAIPESLEASLIYEIMGYDDEFKDPTDISKALGNLGKVPLEIIKSKNLSASQASHQGGGKTNEDGIFVPDDLETISKEPEAPAETKKPDDSIKVVLHGIYSMLETQVEFSDQKPVIVDGRTLVPARGVFEQLGYTVSWDDATSMVTVGGAEKSLQIPIDRPFLRIDGKDYAVDVPAQLVGGRTMIPLRAISWALGMEVEWVEKSKTVNIYYTYAPFEDK